MEKDFYVWEMPELTKFAEAFLKGSGSWNIYWFHKGRPPLDLTKHSNILKILAKQLGEPPRNLRHIEQRVYHFIANMLLQTRDVVRQAKSQDLHPRMMLYSLPTSLRRVATHLELLDLAFLMETGECLPQTNTTDYPKIRAFANCLVRAVQNAVANMNREADGTTPVRASAMDISNFLKSDKAVLDFASEMDTDVQIIQRLWFNIYTKIRSKICQGGEPVLSLFEWRVADLVLLYDPELPLVTREVDLGPERLLRYLFCLVAGAITRLPRPPGDDPVFGTMPFQISGIVNQDKFQYREWVCSVWTAIHNAYCKKETPVSNVYLQRCWYEVRCATYAAIRWRAKHGVGSRPMAALLFAVARRFPNTAAEEPIPWPSLVGDGYVVDLSTVSCQNPHLLSLLDDIGRDLNMDIIRKKGIFDLEIIANLSVELPSSDSSLMPVRDTEIYQNNTVQTLQAMDPTRAEVSIVVEPYSKLNYPKVYPQPSATPVQSDKEDSLSAIIKQALNCRSIVRLKAPRLKELTDEILKKNCLLSETDSSNDLQSDIQVVRAVARKRQRSDSDESEKETEDSTVNEQSNIKKMKLQLAKDISVEDKNTEIIEPRKMQSELGNQLTLDTRIVLDRLQCRSVSKKTEVKLSARPQELSHRYGVSEQTEAWWTRNMHVAGLCRPVGVRLCRLAQRPMPRVALPDIQMVRQVNKSILTAEVAPTRVPPQENPSPAHSQLDSILDEITCSPLSTLSEDPVKRRSPEKSFGYLYKDMVEMMVHNAKRYLPSQSNTDVNLKIVARRNKFSDMISESRELTEQEKWEREKQVGLKYFMIPNSREPDFQEKSKNHLSNAMGNLESLYDKNRVTSEAFHTDNINRLSFTHCDANAVIETPPTIVATTESTRSPSAEITQPLAIPSEPSTSETSTVQSFSISERSVSKKNKESNILCDVLADLMSTDTSNLKKSIHDNNKYCQTSMNGAQGLCSRGLLRATSEPKSLPLASKVGLTLGTDSSARFSRSDEDILNKGKKSKNTWINNVNYFKLPTNSQVTVAQYMAMGGGKAALMRADMRRPQWLIWKSYIVLTKTPVPMSKPTYWTSLRSQRGTTLARVLFPEDDPYKEPSNENVIDLTEEMSVEKEPYKILGDEQTTVLVYNMVQEIATFQRLHSEQQQLFLFSLSTGKICKLKSLTPAALLPLPSASSQTTPVKTSNVSISAKYNDTIAVGNSNVQQVCPSQSKVLSSPFDERSLSPGDQTYV